MIKKPLISVVMPVYGVEDYLREAIDSVVNQDIGFEKNIELILVNDGSPDGSEAICLEYQKMYPNNILYIKQKNQGLSATRYNGFLKARGEFFHSMDSDDAISDNFYSEAIAFLRLNSKRIDFVASKLMFFEARRGGHYLNYRFKESRVIDVNNEPRAFQYHIASVVIRTKALKKEWFDKKISIGEDARLIAMILKEKKAYGVVSSIVYHYRIREAGNSLINTQHLKRDYYTETPKRFWEHILNYWKQEDGTLPKYIQNFVFNDIQWRIDEQKEQHVLSPPEEKSYKAHIYKIISMLDDDVILSAKQLDLYKRIFLLRKKHGNIDDILNYDTDTDKYVIGDTCSVGFVKSDYFKLIIDFIKPLGNNKFFIEGYPANDTLHSKDSYAIKTSLGTYKLKYVDRLQRRKNSFLGDRFRVQEAFEATIEVAPRDNIEAIIATHFGEIKTIPVIPKRNTRIGAIRGAYRRYGDIIIRKSASKLSVHPLSKVRVALFELIFWFNIMKVVRLRHGIEILRQNLHSKNGLFIKYSLALLQAPVFVSRNLLLNAQSIMLRTLFFSGLAKHKQPIWLVSDRGMGAGDNGEAFFKYLMSKDNLPVDAYFVISRRAKDYKRMKSIGPVVKLGSLRYKLLFLRSNKIISSQADEYIINPFGRREAQILDLLSFDFVFLQHGITKNDISDWLNRFFKDIKLFVTASKKEQQSILEYPFYYSKNQVKLTGFPRYDYLENNPKRKIILAPTWRKYLTNGAVKPDGSWQYQEAFKESEYFNFYNNLMNDERLLKIMMDSNVTGEFYLHPSHSAQIKDFEENDVFKIMDYPYDYKKAFAEGSLLVTDYSSVYFDFSYLKKPVIYSQFDRDYYYQNHDVYDKGYFEESRDGFGPVVEDYESTIAEIERAIKAEFTVSKKYLNRVESFFAFHDSNNSQRVYEAVQKLEHQESDQ